MRHTLKSDSLARNTSNRSSIWSFNFSEDIKTHVILLLGDKITKTDVLVKAFLSHPNLTGEKSINPLPSNYIQFTEREGRLALIAEKFNYSEHDTIEQGILQAKEIFAEYLRYGKLIAIAKDGWSEITDGTRYELIWTWKL